MASSSGDLPSKAQTGKNPAADLLRRRSDPSYLLPPLISRKLSETRETPQGEVAKFGREKTVLHSNFTAIAWQRFLPLICKAVLKS